MMAEPQSAYTPTKRTIPARKPERLSYEVAAVNAVLDEALVCHVAYQVDGIPAMIPTLHVRIGDQLYIHGSTGSRLMRAAAENGIPLCIGVTLTDGLVMARTWFNHSVNFRSVIIHGDAVVITDNDEKWDAMVALMDHVAQGRAEGSRSANKREFAATAMLRIPLVEVSLKMRSGPPGDDEEDLELPHWAGVLPMETVFGDPISACDLPVPSYIVEHQRSKRLSEVGD